MVKLIIGIIMIVIYAILFHSMDIVNENGYDSGASKIVLFLACMFSIIYGAI